MEQKSSSLRLSGKRPVPRDIADSLGKLPPQNIQKEEQVLGTLLLESKKFLTIREFMKPEYFYSERHQQIYSAIQQSYEHSGTITLSSVAHVLRQVGKLEMVGGAYFLSETLTKVEHSANVEFDARVIIEHYIKRELILIASAVHHDSYEDDTDSLLLIDDANIKISALYTRVFKQKDDQKIKEMWLKRQVLEQPIEPPPIIHISGIPVAWPGGHTLLVGLKKSRKTLFMIWLIVQYLNESGSDGGDVAVFDTEQSKRHVWRIREKVYQITGKYINVFFLRGVSPNDRREFVETTARFWPKPLRLIVNDGVRDFMHDINDPKESTDVMTFLERLTIIERKDQDVPAHVIDVLHLNKDGKNPRGHIGTELQNKAECTIELTLDEKSGATDVKCESSREKPFTAFSFTHDQDDLPMVINATAGGREITSDERRNRFLMIFEDGDSLTRNQLIKAIRDNFECGEGKAGQAINEFRRYGWLAKIGKDRSPELRYKSLLDAAGVPRPLPENGQQMNLIPLKEAIKKAEQMKAVEPDQEPDWVNETPTESEPKPKPLHEKSGSKKSKRFNEPERGPEPDLPFDV